MRRCPLAGSHNKTACLAYPKDREAQCFWHDGIEYIKDGAPAVPHARGTRRRACVRELYAPRGKRYDYFFRCMLYQCHIDDPRLSYVSARAWCIYFRTEFLVRNFSWKIARSKVAADAATLDIGFIRKIPRARAKSRQKSHIHS